MPIILEPRGTLVRQIERLEDLHTSLSEVNRRVKVKYAYKDVQRGYGVTWYELLGIWLLIKGSETLYQQVLSKTIEVAIAWAKKRIKAESSETERGRPKYITIYDHRGNVAKSFVVWGKGFGPDKPEIEDKTEEDRKRSHSQIPKILD
jgi:hypothetical protein